MSEYFTGNDNARYLLTYIDIFSKYAWVRCLKTKSGAAVTNAFKDILSEGRVPVKLQTDAGTEFYNKHFQHLMDEYKITHFSTSNETKASVVNSRRYVDVVQDLVDAYNKSYHSSIKMAPAAVNKDNEKSVFNILYKMKPQKTATFKFNVGDTVRISKWMEEERILCDTTE